MTPTNGKMLALQILTHRSRECSTVSGSDWTLLAAAFEGEASGSFPGHFRARLASCRMDAIFPCCGADGFAYGWNRYWSGKGVLATVPPPCANGFPVAALFRTVLTLVAGAGLAAGGFVAATMFPEIRGKLSGADLMASTEEPSSFEGEFGAVNDDVDFGTSHANDGFFNSVFGDNAEQSAETNSDSADAFLGNSSVPVDRVSVPPAGNLQRPNSMRPDGLGSTPPRQHSGSFPGGDSGTQWYAAVRQLNGLGISDYTIQPAGQQESLRCDCWVVDGSVRRQLTGFGATPSAAISSLTARVNEFRESSQWFLNSGQQQSQRQPRPQVGPDSQSGLGGSGMSTPPANIQNETPIWAR